MCMGRNSGAGRCCAVAGALGDRLRHDFGLNRTPLRTKIAGGYVLVLALVAIVYIFGVLNLNRLGRASEAILRENYRSILAAEAMIHAIDRQENAVLLLLGGHGETAIKHFREHEVEFLGWLARAQDNITIAEEEQLLETIRTEYAEYLDGFTGLQVILAANPDRAYAFYQETLVPPLLSVRDASRTLREVNQTAMFSASDRARDIAERAVRTTTWVGVSVAALGLAFSILLSHLVVRPLKQIAQAAKRVAEGKYDVDLPIRSRDELGQLAQEFQAMSRKLKGYNDLHVERVLAEKRRSDAVLESVTDGIALLDHDHTLIKANPTFAEVFGTTVHEAEGRHFLDVAGDLRLFEHLRKTTETGKPPQMSDEEATLGMVRGTEKRYYHTVITPINSERGKRNGLVLLLQDVTHLKQLDRLKSRFVMTASHELRTPLTSMVMSLDLLVEGALEKLSDEERELVLAAKEEAVRLKALVNNLLDLSKIESGRMEFQAETVSVGTLAEKAVSVVKAQADEKRIELMNGIGGELPEVRVDENKTLWVLTNLLGNAVRYTQEGGHVHLRAEKAGDFVHVTVQDDGPGIPREYQSRIFEKFVQVDRGGAPGGSGLGLAISKEVVKAQGGTIWVESTEGEGSTFTFTLPVATGRTHQERGVAERGWENPDRG